MDKEELIQVLTKLNVESDTVVAIADKYITYLYIDSLMAVIVLTAIIYLCSKIVWKMLDD